MKKYKIVVTILMVFSELVAYSQTSKGDSLHNERESKNGYFFHNKQFCDKLEEFIDAIEFAKADSLIVIKNINFDCDCKKDSLFVVRVEIKDKDYLHLFLNANSNNIYIYGGKYKGKSIFLRQESIFGKLLRSELGYIDVLEEIDPFLAKCRSKKYDSTWGGGGVLIIGNPHMDLSIDRDGNIKKVQYGVHDFYGSGGIIAYDNIRDVKKFFDDSK